MGFMDDAKNAAENAARKAKDAWEDHTDQHGEDKSHHDDHSGDARRAEATDGTVGKHEESPEQLRRDP
jgi:hypothetical protein